MEVSKIDFDAFMKFQEANRHHAQTGAVAAHPSFPPSSLPPAVSLPSHPHTAGTSGSPQPTALQYSYMPQHGHYPYMPQPGPTYVAQTSGSAVASHNHNAQSATYVPHTGNTAATQVTRRGAAPTNINAAGNPGEAARIRQGGVESNTATAGEANQNDRSAITLTAGEAIHNGTGNNPNSNHPHASEENLIGRENYAPTACVLPHTAQESALMTQGGVIQIPSTPG
mmetsp:Transcript_40445/g.79726  ORF Transcript_40445/g.79726 Transcript_40445/m.79726 type:complete len:226 (-) Transcript_40445:333-1010(-)